MRAAAPAAAVLILATAPGAARAQDALSERPDRVAVVLYQERAPAVDQVLSNARPFDPGLAAVTETRTLDLPAGRSRLVLRGVADAIVPQTVAIEGLPGRLVERNYDFDVLSPGALLGKAVGQPATLVRTNPTTGQAAETAVTIRSGPFGVVLQAADGSAEALGCGGQPERLVFDHAPQGLTASPTLSMTVEPPAAGRYVVKLTYLATGLRWSADYVARVRPDGRTLDLTGWLTLQNDGATSFEHAPAQVIAGRLARQPGADVAPGRLPPVVGHSCWPVEAAAYSDDTPRPPPPPPAPARRNALEEVTVTAARQAVVTNLGDYKLYTLPEPTTLAARQTKQVAFLDKRAAPFERIYSFPIDALGLPSQDGAVGADIVLRLQNRAAKGLGAPLPGGAVAVFEPGPGGRSLLVGQDAVKDTPLDLPLEIAVGAAPDVTLASRRLKVETFLKAGVLRQRVQVELTLRNAGRAAAAVEVKQNLDRLKVTSESRPHKRDGANGVWPIFAPPGGERTLNLTLEQTG